MTKNPAPKKHRLKHNYDGDGGRRINIWVPERYLRTLDDIENNSRFFQLALEQCVGIMAWALLKDRQPEKYYDTEKYEDLIDPFNAKYPLDPLTKKRKDIERIKRENSTNSPRSNRELW